MIKKILLTIFSICACTFLTNANATFDRTHVTLTNNTSQAISVHSTLETDDRQFKKGSGWDESSLNLDPYQSKEILWFERNVGVKKDHHYQFTVTTTHADYAGENVVFNFDVTGKTTYGSELTTNLSLPHEVKKSVLTDNGLRQFPANMWNGKFVIHARKWKPTSNLFENYHIVIDKPETNIETTPKNTQLSILTYNTQLMPFYTGGVNDLNQPERRAHNIAKNIANYDVVIMEELLDRDLRIIMTIDMNKNYPYHTRVVGHDTTLPLTGGVVIFSKWPITKEDQIVYVANSGIDSLAAKGVAYAAINKNGRKYHIFGTHAVSGDSNDAVIARSKELAELQIFISRMNIPANEPVLIGGDFNVNQYENEIQTLLSTLHVNLPDNLGYQYSIDAHVNLMETGKERKRLDYVFYSNMHTAPKIAYNKVFILRALDDEEKWPKFDLSDHFPVAAYFDFSESMGN